MTWQDLTIPELKARLVDAVPPSQMPSKKAELIDTAILHLGPTPEAVSRDSTESVERAVEMESTGRSERAGTAESTDVRERAAGPESTGGTERAEPAERTEQGERAPLMTGDESAASVRKGMPAVSARAADAVEEWKQGEPEPLPEAQLPELTVWQKMETMATRLARSSLIPSQFKNKPDDVLVILLQAHDLGLTTSMVLSEIVVIDGKPTKSAFLLRFLVRRAGHKLKTHVDYNAHGHPVAAIATGSRKDDPTDVFTVRYTIEQAEKAHLCKINDDGSVTARSGFDKPLPWELHTEDLLIARVTSRACRRNFEDVVGGAAYVPEELGYIDSEGEETEPTGAPAAAPTALDALTVQSLRDRIEKLNEELREEVRGVWKRQHFPAIDALTTAHYGPINAIIEAREKRMPEDAEVVGSAEDPEGADDAERAVDQEGTEVAERAVVAEGTDDHERADIDERTEQLERAVRTEGTATEERAVDDEGTGETERTETCPACLGDDAAEHEEGCLAAPF